MPNWGAVLEEIQQHQLKHAQEAKSAVDVIRRSYLSKLHHLSGRNIIAYYSAFLTKPDIDSELNDEDKNGFMMAVHELDRRKGLDLILHTPGGSVAATQSIVDYLRKMFGQDIRAVVPQIAMSAGTMIACSSKSRTDKLDDYLFPSVQFRAQISHGSAPERNQTKETDK